MSLLKKASIITTPTAYAEDYLYSIKPAYALGSELVTNGTFDTDSDWTKGTGWTISGGVASNSGSGSYLTSTSSFRWEIGKKYRVSLEITAYNSGQVSLPFDATGGNANYQNSVGVKTAIIVALATNPIYIYSSGFNGSIDNVSVKEITDADFDFDRNSTGTRVNEDYLIEDVPYNFAQNSEDIDGTGWSNFFSTLELNSALAPDGTQTADKIISTSGGRLDCVVSNGMANTQYTTSFYAKANNTTAALCQIYEDSSGTFLATLDYTNLINTETWTRITVTYTTTVGGNIRSQIIKNMPNGESVFFWGTQVVKGDQPKDYLKTTDRLDIPRIDYTNGEPSILLEPSRTNLIPNSTTTIANNTTIEYNNILSPENILNGVKVTSTASSAYVRTDTVAMTSNNTISVFLKAGTSNYAQVLGAGNAGDFFNINLENFTIGNTGATTSNVTIQQYSNNWYRCSAKFAGYTGNTTIRLLLSDSDSNFNATNSTTGKFLYYYGLQLETGSYPTSLIHTSGSAVTRSQDVGSNAGNSDLISSTEGVLYAEVNFKNVTAGTYLSISDGSSSNRIIIGVQSGTARVYASSLVTTFSIDFDRYNKIAYSYKANERKIFLNGESVYSSTASYTVPTGLNELSFDSTGAGAQDTEGNVKSVMVFKEALSDEELECLTGYNNHELYMNYYNRLSYLGLVEEYNVESDINNYIL